jgi:hypothetical protein
MYISIIFVTNGNHIMVIPNTVIKICHLKMFLLVDSYCLFILNIMVSETLEIWWLFKLTTKNIYYLILCRCYAKSFTDFIYTVVQSCFLLLELYVNKDLCIIFCCLFIVPLTCLLPAYIDFSSHTHIQLQTFNIVNTNLPVTMNSVTRSPLNSASIVNLRLE